MRAPALLVPLAVLSACSSSTSPVASPPGVVRQAHPPPRGIDVSTMPVWPVRDDGAPVVEIFAKDAQPSVLMAPLLEPGKLFISFSFDTATGRVSAPSRRSAARAVQWRSPGWQVDVGRGGDPIDVALFNAPPAAVTGLLSRLMGARVVWLAHPWQATILGTQVSAGALLGALAEKLELDTIRDGDDVLVFHAENRAAVVAALAQSGPPIDIAVDDAPLSAAHDLVAEVAPASEVSCANQRVSFAVQRENVGRVVARLSGARLEQGCVPTQVWDGERGLRDDDRLVGIVHADGKSAALLETSHGMRLLRPGWFRHGRIVISHDAVTIRYSGSVWTSRIDFDALRGRPWNVKQQAVVDTLVTGDEALSSVDRSWRLAATMRDGDQWRALVVSNRSAWAWVDRNDPRVIAIEAGRLMIVRDGLTIELPLASAR